MYILILMGPKIQQLLNKSKINRFISIENMSYDEFYSENI